MAAAIAIIKTAPAARSFVFFIISLYSGETKSANDSMDELIASADNTAPITITTAIHSVWDKPKKKPAITTQIAAKQCIHALCSFCINKRMPLKAYRKLASRLRKVKPLFFILFIVLRERDKDSELTQHIKELPGQPHQNSEIPFPIPANYSIIFCKNGYKIGKTGWFLLSGMVL